MPDLIRLRYLGPSPVVVPVLSREVEPDGVIDIPGRVLTEDDQGRPAPDDATLIEFGNPPQVRAWPTSTWRVEPTKKTTKE